MASKRPRVVDAALVMGDRPLLVVGLGLPSRGRAPGPVWCRGGRLPPARRSRAVSEWDHRLRRTPRHLHVRHEGSLTRRCGAKDVAVTLGGRRRRDNRRSALSRRAGDRRRRVRKRCARPGPRRTRRRGHQLVHQAQCQRLLQGRQAATEGQFLGPRRPDRPYQAATSRRRRAPDRRDLGRPP